MSYQMEEAIEELELEDRFQDDSEPMKNPTKEE